MFKCDWKLHLCLLLWKLSLERLNAGKGKALNLLLIFKFWYIYPTKDKAAVE